MNIRCCEPCAETFTGCLREEQRMLLDPDLSDEARADSRQLAIFWTRCLEDPCP